MTVPLSAVAQLAGGAPDRILRIALAPICVSMASSSAFLTRTENCKAMGEIS
jgi:hypothetical protein